MPDPVRGEAYDFSISLIDTANRPYFRANPTLAAGDFKVSKDEGPLANLTTLPTVTPAGSVLVHVSFSATEMDADNVTLVCRDAAGAEWDDLLISISTEAEAAVITPTPANGVTAWSGLDLVKTALRKIGVLAAGEDPDGVTGQDALGELNRLMDSWNLQAGMAYSSTQLSKVLSASQSSLTIGPGGDINTTRPVRFQSGYTRSSTRDVPLEFITQPEYDELPYKTTFSTTWPCLAFYKPDVPLATLYLFPPPTGANTLYLAADTPFAGFATLAQTVNLPPGYVDAAIYGLARRLAPEYGRALDALFLEEYRMAMKWVMRQNHRPQFMGMDPALRQAGRRWRDDQYIIHGGF